MPSSFQTSPFIVKLRTKEFDISKLELKEIAVKMKVTNSAANKLALTPIVDQVTKTAITNTETTTGYMRFGQGVNCQNASNIAIEFTIYSVIKPILRELSIIFNPIHDAASRRK